jgi:hypothetical protein
MTPCAVNRQGRSGYHDKRVVFYCFRRIDRYRYSSFNPRKCRLALNGTEFVVRRGTEEPMNTETEWSWRPPPWRSPWLEHPSLRK